MARRPSLKPKPNRKGVDEPAPPPNVLGGRVRLAWILGIGVLAVAASMVPFWSGQQRFNPDGMSYLNIATEAAGGDWAELGNQYWSPLYPFLIALVLKLGQPGPMDVVPYQHLVNWFGYITTVAAFGFFWWNWRGGGDRPPASQTGFALATFFAFAFLHWTVANYIKFSETTPDIWMMCFLCLAAGLVCRLRERPGRRVHALLGVALGLGFYAKSAMLPSGLILIAILWWRPPAGKAARWRLAWTLAALGITAGPWIAVQSVQAGRPSIGATGRLNYAWFVNGVRPFCCWTGVLGYNGTPLHPTERITEKPETFVFGAGSGGTFPLWYDPAYWHEGLQVPFSLERQWRKVTKLIPTFQSKILPAMKAPALCLAVLWVAAIFFSRRLAVRLTHPWLVVWPLGVALMYGMVTVEVRYLAAYSLFFWLALGAAAARGVRSPWRWVLLGVLTVWLYLPEVPRFQRQLARFGEPISSREQRAAEYLKARGLEPGDLVATVGLGFYALYAHLAEVRVAGMIVPDREFWALPLAEQQAIQRKLADQGVRVLFAERMPEGEHHARWEELPEGWLHVLWLRR